METLNNQWKLSIIKKGKISFYLLETGDLFKIMDEDQQVNLLQGNPFDGMISNLYLREKLPSNAYRVEKLMGVASHSRWVLTNDGAIYEGKVWDVTYQLHLIVNENGWFYQLHLKGTKNQSVYDVMYGQDVGIAHPFGILSNEAYTSQYIDHQVFEKNGFITLLSRQNQGKTHFLQVGSDTPTVGYSTDAMQFFGLDYKKNHLPAAYQMPLLPSKNYQYEFAYLALQTQPFSLNSVIKTITFYGYSTQQQDVIKKEAFPLPVFPKIPWTSVEGNKIQSLLNPRSPLFGKELSVKEIFKLYPEQADIEKEGEHFLSSFLDDGSHLVGQYKELKVERPHGHILLSGDVFHATENVYATTAYMFGVFGSHTVYGNTNFHKLTGDLRHPLNAHTISGTRIYIEMSGVYQLLGMPSLFIMGLDTVKWIYVLEKDTIQLSLSVNGKDPLSRLSFYSEQKKSYNLKISHQLLLDTNEYNQPIQYTFDGKFFEVDGRSNGMIANHYSGLRYRLSANRPYTFNAGRDLVPTTHDDGGLIYFSFQHISSLNLYTQATLDGTFKQSPETIIFDGSYPKLVQNLIPLKLSHPLKQETMDAFNRLIPWYVHDALVHYASPHGLEQYNGAAWGTRDVLQGPFELFISGQRFDICREILIKVFSRQFLDTKEFPQWFMFDNYRHIQAHESHGDVMVWPLKALASYLDATADVSILSEMLPYMDKKTGTFTAEKSLLSDHVWDVITTLQHTSIQGTSLPAYGGGDWDDTLQPANQTLTKLMVSAWTVALLYESLSLLVKFPIFSTDKQQKFTEYKDNLKKDFHKYLIVDKVPAGFVIFHSDHREVLLHPHDQTTGLNYRLLPFNRGMISQIFEPSAIPTYQSIINQHLRHPDGVRLMNTAVTYQGGKKTYFQRAETAASFGREIGIQYVHAHIRYIEAMCTIGNKEEAWWGLNVINPINMYALVPNAALRQRNVYFSSSDGAFYDRYEAKKDFEKVRQGKIQVKAGWRLYSSGPGIYLNTLIQKFLGIQVKHHTLSIDPQVPASLAGLIVEYKFKDKPLSMKIPLTPQTEKSHNPYRSNTVFETKENANRIQVKIKE